MSKLDLTIIREILMDEQVTLVAAIQNEQNKLKHYTEENPDLSDLADKRLHQEIALSWISHLNQRLTQVRAALKRLAERKYGICARCRKAINPERLKAIPYTVFCVNCQERREHIRYL